MARIKPKTEVKKEPQTPKESNEEIQTPKESNEEIQTPKEEIQTPKESNEEIQTPKETSEESNEETQTPKEPNEETKTPKEPKEETQTPKEPKEETQTPKEPKEESKFPSIDLLMDRFLGFNFASSEAISGSLAFIVTISLELERDKSKDIMKHIMSKFLSIEGGIHSKNLTRPTLSWKGDKDSREAYLALITVASAIEREALSDISGLSIIKQCNGKFAPLGNRIASIWFD